ncbi:zinc-dependent alcohol dehydrogenase family protein [Rugamonas apoptosis]|uniref:alcohol dehydrogenase n=1 Tax=Rugamonas apoptosis TaxID=2758570 RepID=A0A7W2F9P4_9BURK|nr:zinc-dependent alcohol dehydrogenase family protein [Rugamonas apoptosis]MBA5687733.1 zinc-dependent alcohol dehydrogenase family protein [Rugamonas apoptosis]
MLAMLLDQPGAPLRAAQLPVPQPGPWQVLLRVSACGVCRTDLHIVDGELPPHHSPVIPGHEVVGRVVACGQQVHDYAIGERVGVAWLGASCGTCPYCARHTENLCDAARFTGYDLDGGYAQYMVADARYIFRLPARYDDVAVAPLLCAGLIGYRAYAMAGDAQRIGLYGFGAAAHLLAQLASQQGRQVYAFTRPGDERSQRFARALGAVWAGAAGETPPAELDAALLFAPDGALVPQALHAVRKGGTVVCAGIHMSDIPSFPYHLLWGERAIRSVANLTRADGEQFFALAQQYRLDASTTTFPLREANAALAALRAGAFDGAAVLVP